MHTHIYIYTYTHTHIYIYIYYTHIYKHTSIYTYIYTHTYTYIYTHIYIHIHTQIYTYISYPIRLQRVMATFVFLLSYSQHMMINVIKICPPFHAKLIFNILQIKSHIRIILLFYLNVPISSNGIHR